MSFRLVQKLVTLNDLERRSGCYFRVLDVIFFLYSKIPAFNIYVTGTISNHDFTDVDLL